MPFENVKVRKIAAGIALAALGALFGLASAVLPAYIPIAVVLTGILFVVFLLRLHWGLYLLLFVVPMDAAHMTIYNDYASKHSMETNASVQWFLVFVIIIMAAWIVSILSKLGKKPGHAPVKGAIDPILLLISVLVVWNAISLLWTPNFVIGLVNFCRLCSSASIFLFFYFYIDSPDLLRKVGWACLFSGTVVAGIAIYSLLGYNFRVDFPRQYWAGQTEALVYRLSYEINDFMTVISDFRIHRYRGVAWMSPAEVAFSMNFYIAIGVGMLLSTSKEKRRERALIILIIMVLLSGHFTTLSRAGTVSLLVMIFFLLFSFRVVREKFLKHFLITLVVCVVLYCIIQNQRIFDIALQRMGGDANETSFQTRWHWWVIVMHKYFLTSGRGSGIGASYYYLAPNSNTHNIYISIISDMGIFGICLFLTFVMYILKGVLPVLRDQKTTAQYILMGGFGALLAWSAQGLLDGHYGLTKQWLFGGVIMAAYKLVKREPAEAERLPASLSDASR